MIEYRPLRPDELADVYAVFERRGIAPPDPSVSVVIGAVGDDRVLGFIVAQLVPHLEPIHINEGERGRVNWRELVEAAENSLRASLQGAYYAFSESDGISALCKRSGMTEMPYKVFRKEID